MAKTEPTQKYNPNDTIMPQQEINKLEDYEVKGIIHPYHPNVFSGRHKKSGLEVVIKTAVPFFLEAKDIQLDPVTIGNICICYEYSIQESLDHPNILAPIELYRQNDSFFLITPKIGDTDFHPNYRNIKQTPEETKLSYLAQIASAISYCHSKGVVHLDVKPGNIRVDKDKATLIDFGAARRLEDKHIIIDRIHLSTPDVVAPEHKFDHKITPYADVFSFSCLAYNILTGQKPFNYIDHFETLKYKSPSHNKKELEMFGNLAGLIIKGMSYNYFERPNMLEITESIKEQAAKYSHQPSERPLEPSPVLVQ